MIGTVSKTVISVRVSEVQILSPPPAGSQPEADRPWDENPSPTDFLILQILFSRGIIKLSKKSKVISKSYGIYY